MKKLDYLEDKYRKFLEYERMSTGYDDSIENYEKKLRKEFKKFTEEDKNELRDKLISNFQYSLEDCFVENHTAEAIEYFYLLELLNK